MLRVVLGRFDICATQHLAKKVHYSSKQAELEQSLL